MQQLLSIFVTVALTVFLSGCNDKPPVPDKPKPTMSESFRKLTSASPGWTASPGKGTLCNFTHKYSGVKAEFSESAPGETKAVISGLMCTDPELKPNFANLALVKFDDCDDVLKDLNEKTDYNTMCEYCMKKEPTWGFGGKEAHIKRVNKGHHQVGVACGTFGNDYRILDIKSDNGQEIDACQISDVELKEFFKEAKEGCKHKNGADAHFFAANAPPAAGTAPAAGMAAGTPAETKRQGMLSKWFGKRKA